MEKNQQPEQPKVAFDLASYLKENSMSYAGRDSAGNVLVEDKVSGQKGVFDVPGLIKELGGDPASVAAIEYNSPDEPVNQSFLSAADRAKIGVGNTKGALTYLAKNFEGATLTEKDGLLVKKDGAWHKVDADGINQYFNDPWEFARDVADLTDVGINIAATTYGAAKGAAIGAAAGAPAGGVGAIPGAAIGGIAGAGLAGGVSGAIRTSLGRLVGTYEADAQEQLADIGIETVLSAGGQAVSLGVKPTMGMLKNAIGKISNTASEGSRAVLESTLARTTGAGDVATRVLFDSTDDVLTQMTKLSKKAGSEAVESIAKQEQIQAVNEILETATKTLPQKYGSLLDELATKADLSKLKVNVTDIVDSTVNSLDEMGFGKVVPIIDDKVVGYQVKDPITGGLKTVDELATLSPGFAFKGGSKTALQRDPITNAIKSVTSEESGRATAIAGSSTQSGKPIIKSEVKGYKFEPFSEQELFDRAKEGLPSNGVSPEAVDVINGVLTRINKLRPINGGEGKAAAKSLQRLNSAINGIVDEIYDTVSPSAQKALATLKSGTKNGIAGSFQKSGLETEYKAMQSVYSQYGDAVAEARRVLKNDSAETLVDKLVSMSGRNEKAKGMTKALIELAGPDAENKFRKVMINEAVKKFHPPFNKNGLMPTALVGGSVATGSFPVMAGAVAASSPRLVAKTTPLLKKVAQGTSGVANPLVNYSLEAVNAFSKLKGPQMTLMLQRPDLLESFFNIPGQAAQQEQQGLQQLLQQGGVLPQGEPQQ